MTRGRRFAVAGMLVAVLVAGSASAPTAAQAQSEPSEGADSASDFAAARKKWDENRPESYRVTVTQLCFCLTEVVTPRTVTVEGDEVTSVDPPIPDDIGFDIEVLTVDVLFDILERALADADEVVVSYNEDYGFPESISIDWIELAVDDEVTYTAESFEPLGCRVPKKR